ncbi:MAG: hypothetical protein ABSB83_04270 [Methanomassiliicoccales archaeon]|jgi:hypothetical protein
MVCVWIWFVMRGGRFQISATRAELNLDISLLVLLFILAAGLGGLYYMAEMFSYRKEYLAKKAAPDQISNQVSSAKQPKTEPAPRGQSPSEQPAIPRSTDQSQKGSP